jgi:hypothetical protein
MAESSGTVGTKKTRKIHLGEALRIIPTRESLYVPPSTLLIVILYIIAIPPSNKRTNRYRKGELDLDSIIAFLTHQRESGDMPREILRVRGRLRNAFPGFRSTKTSIRAAYEKAGWDINELSLLTKKQVREFGEVTRPDLTMCLLIHREERLENNAKVSKVFFRL